MRNIAYERINEIYNLEVKIIKLVQKQKEANHFIIEIANLLGIETDGIGYDDLQLTIDDFQEAINSIRAIKNSTVDAYCPKCEAYIVNERVTNDECCDSCQTKIEWETL